MPPIFTQCLLKMDESLVGIIILTDQKIVYHNELIFRELCAMILPVVLVRPLELVETFLDRKWGWLRVIEVSRQLHEEIGQEWRDIVWESFRNCTKPKYSAVVNYIDNIA